jgi:DNA-binding MarR family transcriptional regulator
MKNDIELNTFSMLLEEFRKLDPEMPIHFVRGFIEIARRPGLTMRDLGTSLGISQSSTSRMVQALSKWHRLNKPGHALVEAHEDPAERRRKIITLTPKGERFANAVINQLTVYHERRA